MRRTLLASLLLSSAAAPAFGQEAFYLTVFGAQRPEVNRPKYTHTFATFVHARWSGGACSVESFTISWLPRKEPVQPIRLLPESGVNLDLYTTLRLVQEQGERVSMWGPYQVHPDLYRRALAQKAHLESGVVRYKAVDTGWPARTVSNCIHAVADIDGDRPFLRIASPGWGDPASYYVMLHLLPWVVDPCRTHEWVFDALRLRCYGIRRLDLRQGNPSPRPVLRAAMSALQFPLQKQANHLLSACPQGCSP